jgi:hypothetical protein
VTVSSITSLLLRRAKFGRLALMLLVALPFAATAQEQEERHQLEEKTSTELEKLKPLVDAKNWDGALALLNGLKSKVGPESFDMAIITDVEAKIYLQKGDYSKVIAPWEIALRLTDKHKYLSENSVQELIYYMAQIHYQEATSTKVAAVQKAHFAKANAYLERWLANTTKPLSDPSRQDAAIFYSNLLYNQAVIDPEKVDMEFLRKAEAEVEKGLRMSTNPKETFYIILLAISQQQGNYTRLADILELMVKQYPQKKDYWAQLAGVYGNLAALEKNERKVREYNIRSIHAIERAQALGFMTTQKENYTIFGLYFNVGQFGRATEILHSGLRNGTIESDQKNWELLASSYQQVDQPFRAIEALNEGAKKFPKSGQLDYQAATIHYSLNKPEGAYKALQSAIAKGGLSKPGAVHAFMGYVCWELGKHAEALESINKALASPDTKNDKQLPQLKQAVEEAIRDREAAAAEKAQAPAAKAP